MSRGSSQSQLTEEFAEAFDAYADALYRHAYMRVSNSEQAQDLVQDAYMKCWDAARQGGTVRSWRALLYASLHNLIIDYYRKHKSSSLDAVLEQEGVSEGHFTELTSESTVAEQLDEQRAQDDLHTKLAQLESADRDIIMLRLIDGLSSREVAKVLDISLPAVHVRLHRAKQKLTVLYEQDNVHKEKNNTKDYE